MIYKCFKVKNKTRICFTKITKVNIATSFDLQTSQGKKKTRICFTKITEVQYSNKFWFTNVSRCMRQFCFCDKNYGAYDLFAYLCLISFIILDLPFLLSPSFFIFLIPSFSSFSLLYSSLLSFFFSLFFFFHMPFFSSFPLFFFPQLYYFLLVRHVFIILKASCWRELFFIQQIVVDYSDESKCWGPRRGKLREVYLGKGWKQMLGYVERYIKRSIF